MVVGDKLLTHNYLAGQENGVTGLTWLTKENDRRNTDSNSEGVLHTLQERSWHWQHTKLTDSNPNLKVIGEPVTWEEGQGRVGKACRVSMACRRGGKEGVGRACGESMVGGRRRGGWSC